MITLCDGAKKCIYLAMNKMQTWIQMRKMSLVWGTATTKTSENILSTLSEIILKKKKRFRFWHPHIVYHFVIISKILFHFVGLFCFCFFLFLPQIWRNWNSSLPYCYVPFLGHIWFTEESFFKWLKGTLCFKSNWLLKALQKAWAYSSMVQHMGMLKDLHTIPWLVRSPLVSFSVALGL